jgi:hypothetical protein
MRTRIMGDNQDHLPEKTSSIPIGSVNRTTLFHRKLNINQDTTIGK